MKKVVLIGLILLIMLLVICFFFSGTVKTLTLPKVMITQPRQGRLKDEIVLTGHLVFSKTTDIKLSDLPMGTTLMITKCNVAPGNYVIEGDVLFETKLTDAENLIDTQNRAYSDAQIELIELERENNELRLHRNDEAWIKAYDALVLAYSIRHTAQITLEVEARLQGVSLYDDRLPDDINVESLVLLQAAVDDAEQDVQNALDGMDKAERFGIADAAYQYVMKRREIEARMDQATQQIVSLHTLERSTKQIIATHSGYITQVNVAVGQNWDGISAALVMSTPDAQILLHAKSSGASRSVDEGAVVDINGRFGPAIKTTVHATGINSLGEPYVDVVLQQQELALLDTPGNLMSKGITMRINYTAGSSAMLLPACAVRGSGEAHFVYSLKEVENSFGEKTLITEYFPVSIIDESGDTVAVTGVPDHVKIAYMEDRAIGPGSEVMAYD